MTMDEYRIESARVAIAQLRDDWIAKQLGRRLWVREARG